MRNGNGNRIAYRFTTKSLPVFTTLHKIFYQANKKIIPNNLEIDPLSLAVWFMDDGSKSRSAVYLNTQQFTLDGQQKLLNLLKNKFNLIGSLNKDKKYFRIRINTESTKHFKEIVKPYIIKLFNYKLD